MRGEWGGGCGVSANEYSFVRGRSPNKLWNLTPYLTYDWEVYVKEREEVAEQGVLFKVFIIYVPLTTVHCKKRLATFPITFFYGVGTFGPPTERCLADAWGRR